MKYLIKILKQIKQWFLSVVSKRSHEKCDCGDDNCKREVFVNKRGTLEVKNHFTCRKVKEIVENGNKIIF